MQSITLGEVEVIRVEELDTELLTLNDIFAEHDPAVVQANQSWLAPDHWNPATNGWHTCVHSYVLRSAGRTIVIDTGLGNHKERPHFPVATHLDTDFIARLAAVGVQPADVDVVVCTHVHVDHVGWNTTLQGREWVPTFPNATYHFAQADVEFWNPLNPHRAGAPGNLMNQNVFEDSVAPVIQANKAILWEGDSFQIDENLRLEAANGHTPGSAIIVLESAGERALFVGDITHSPIQLLNPDWNSCFDEDEVRARTTRNAIVARAADTKTPMFATHYVGGRAAEVVRDGDRYRIAGWTPFDQERR
jgi:glyoxylase-like metal-dependent hydrolase (beta-lactamase superfamily II)